MSVEGSSKRVRIQVNAHRRFQRWVQEGVFERIWVKLLQEYDDVQGDKMEMAVARLELGQGASGGAKTGPNPTDRAKLGSKRHILTDQRGTSLSAVITGAHVHDMKATMETLDGTVVRRHHPDRIIGRTSVSTKDTISRRLKNPGRPPSLTSPGMS